LTEDLDLGVRLAIRGWENRFCGETFVDQQGLTSIPRLVRQRTRWAHGHFQCWKLLPRIISSDMPTVTVLGMCYYLVAPAFVFLSSIIFTLGWIWFAASAAAHTAAWLTPRGAAFAFAMYLFSMGPTLVFAAIYWRRSRDISPLAVIVQAHLLVLYNYIWYVAEWKALVRIISRKTGWAKTARAVETSAPLPGI
jgi:cellulose synthase/poly-beta-1,6-N-acetylglucosamine synthase-like glycosyltransferase